MIGKKNEVKRAPLLNAILCHDIDAVAASLAGGADPNAIDTNGMTMLMYAAYTNSVESARLLLDHGANVNAATPDGTTALHYTQENPWGSPGVIAVLLEHGADPNAAGDDQMAALWLAAGNPRGVEAVRTLIQGGANVNLPYQGWTPLQLTLSHPWGAGSETAKMLREAGAQ